MQISSKRSNRRRFVRKSSRERKNLPKTLHAIKPSWIYWAHISPCFIQSAHILSLCTWSVCSAIFLLGSGQIWVIQLPLQYLSLAFMRGEGSFSSSWGWLHLLPETTGGQQSWGGVTTLQHLLCFSTMTLLIVWGRTAAESEAGWSASNQLFASRCWRRMIEVEWKVRTHRSCLVAELVQYFRKHVSIRGMDDTESKNKWLPCVIMQSNKTLNVPSV